MTQLRSGAGLDVMLRHLNRFVMHNIGSSVFFFTVAAARIDRGGRRMVFAGAGHPPGMIVRDGQEPRLLESRSMVLGALPEAVGPEVTLDVDLEEGDRVVLYTDGITDVFNVGRRGRAEVRARDFFAAISSDEAGDIGSCCGLERWTSHRRRFTGFDGSVRP
jgi:serine phosphatase RsbU (regulator of sigma subunit)